MLTEDHKNRVLESTVVELELPETAYERAKVRYEDVGQFLGREGSECAGFSPLISAQGSFRLGTAIKPINDGEAYDLDLSSVMRKGVDTSVWSEKDLKDMIGRELERFRIARQIKKPLEPKHRCWRVEYSDDLSFHLDVVPSTVTGSASRVEMTESMVRHGQDKELASDIAQYSVWITDDRHRRYALVPGDWQLSNPEGYARWFESRMRQGELLLFETRAKIVELPTYRRKTALQRAIQILKRHRDKMFVDQADSKPISIIITTIAASAYRGELSLLSALRTILGELTRFATSGSTVLLNPVNPAENFADRWTMKDCAHLRLRENFALWVRQANADFETLIETENASVLSEHLANRFSVRKSANDLARAVGVGGAPAIHVPKKHTVTGNEPKPWSR